MDKINELELQVERYKNMAIGLTVDLNISKARISELEAQLKDARRQVRSMELDTQTVQNLSILQDEDDDGFDPRATGQFRRPWERAK